MEGVGGGESSRSSSTMSAQDKEGVIGGESSVLAWLSDPKSGNVQRGESGVSGAIVCVNVRPVVCIEKGGAMGMISAIQARVPQAWTRREAFPGFKLVQAADPNYRT